MNDKPEMWENFTRLITLKQKAVKLVGQMAEALVMKKRQEEEAVLWHPDFVITFCAAYKEAVINKQRSFVFTNSMHGHREGIEYNTHYAYYLLLTLKRAYYDDYRVQGRLSNLSPPPIEEEKS